MNYILTAQLESFLLPPALLRFLYFHTVPIKCDLESQVSPLSFSPL
jgi:hypothetical protein